MFIAVIKAVALKGETLLMGRKERQRAPSQ
jgi:hypothetical protein